MKMKFGLALALSVLFQLPTLNAAPIDREVAILASEQSQGNNETTQTPPSTSKPQKKSKQELEAEKKRLREERRAEERKMKEERETARKQIEEGKKEEIKTTDNRRTNPPTRRTSTGTRDDNTQAATSDSTPSVAPATNSNPTTNTNPTTNANPATNSNPVANTNPNVSTNTNPNVNKPANTNATPSVGIPNPLKPYASFEDLSKAVGFTPLYLPKKSGYSVNEIYSLDNKVAEVRYGRRWEPEVNLIIRTYKRAPNEELKDISGVYGVKWRIDTTANTTIYIAKVNDATNVAAWAVGDYTFSAYVENLSFAAFHTLVVEELVDLSKHYFV